MLFQNKIQHFSTVYKALFQKKNNATKISWLLTLPRVAEVPQQGVFTITPRWSQRIMRLLYNHILCTLKSSPQNIANCSLYDNNRDS